ncbi:MAG: RluA family pseudouridine synthase [Melioribacteraceae bacterium]|nr:RluA family pseudouridine synthase [Melioribacteraceae bacterium]
MANIITERLFEYDLSEGEKKKRIDIYLANVVEYASRSRIQHLIKHELVTINGKVAKANSKVVAGDKIVLRIPCHPRPDVIEAEEIPLDIIYEDESFLLVNKAAGMVVHPAFGNHTGTMVHALLHHVKDLSNMNDDPARPGIVHRIDKETSGLLVVAKDEWTHAQLAYQFQDHSIEREYWAIVWGHFKEPKGEIIGNITRSKKDRKVFTVSETEGKHAHTFYEVIEEFEFLTLVKLHLKTGRTHQIRVHMNHINHPVFGDPVYNGRAIRYGSDLPKVKARVENLLKIMNRQALHAKTLGFIHPKSKEKVFFESELPDDMKEVLEKIKITE